MLSSVLVTVFPSFASAGLGSYGAEEVWRRIRTGGIRHIEPLLEALSGPDDLVTPTMLSRDPATFASARFPRVVATSHLNFGLPKSFIAFTGKPGAPGYDRLQLLEFDRSRVRFTAHEFEFPAERGENGPVVWHREPAQCFRCHSDLLPAFRQRGIADEGVVPIWDAYPKIPGFFGEEAAETLASPSLLRLRDRLPEWKERPRYRRLAMPSHSYPLDIREPQRTIEPQHLTRVRTDFEDGVAYMGATIGLLNTERIRRRMRESVHYSSAVPLLVAALSDVSDATFLRTLQRHLPQIDAPTFERSKVAPRERIASYWEHKLERIAEFERVAISADFRSFTGETIGANARRVFNHLGVYDDGEVAPRLRWVFRVLGIERQRISTTLEDADALGGPESNMAQKLTAMTLRTVLASDAPLRNTFPPKVTMYLYRAAHQLGREEEGDDGKRRRRQHVAEAETVFEHFERALTTGTLPCADGLAAQDSL